MTKRKEMPEPWIFDPENVGKSFEWCWQIRTEFSGTPVYVECSNRYGRDHSNEDVARLVAAAPDLYEALARMNHNYDGWDRAQLEKRWGMEMVETILEARAALAKARGETE